MKTKEITIPNKRTSRCRSCISDITNNGVVYYCIKDADDKIVNEEICKQCESYKSRYIEYPLTINGIENKKIDTTGLFHTCGELCSVKPCGEEYKGKCYFGIYIGDLPIAISSSYNEETGILTNRTTDNPAIFVPELNKIIYGCESWWRKIDSIDEFKDISDEDISNTWYVKMLKDMLNGKNS